MTDKFIGFEEATKGCCGTGLIEVTKLCNSKTATTCSDVNKYVFWDSYHPTERAYKAIVSNIFDNYLQDLI
jgi:phospholipase/lecithinase/hemolysin